MSAEFLKDVFGNEALTFEALEQKLAGNDKIKLVNLAGGDYVSKHKYTEALNDLAAEKEKLKDYDPQWQEKISQAQTNASQQINDFKRNALLEAALNKAGARDFKAVTANLDLEKITLSEDGNELAGLSDQLKALQEEKSFLFGTDKPMVMNLGARTNGGTAAVSGGLRGAINEYYNR